MAVVVAVIVVVRRSFGYSVGTLLFTQLLLTFGLLLNSKHMRGLWVYQATTEAGSIAATFIMLQRSMQRSE